VKRSTLLTSSLACLLCASPASAQLHQSDVALRVVDDATGSGVRQMQTGWYNPCAQALSFPHRIFVTRLGDFDTINDPGFDAESGSLPPNTQVGFDILAALRLWNGADFSQIASPRLRVRLGPPSNSRFTPLTDVIVPGFGFSTSSAGLFHFHFNYTLVSSAQPPAVPAESGIYLLQLRMWANAPGIRASEPLYLLLAQQADDAELAAAAAALAISSGLPWTCAATPSCLGDLVGGDGNPPADGSLDGNDFTAFLNAFAAAGLLADLVGGDGNPPADGSVDGNDFAAFLNAFGAGC